MNGSTIAAILTGIGVTLVGGGVVWAARNKNEGKPDEAGTVMIVAEANDTLSDLALALYGDAALWWVVGGWARRRIETPSVLMVGDRLDVPCTWTTIRKGESLAAVAKRMLGDDKKWGRIRAANRNLIKDPNAVQAGWRVAVPTPPSQFEARAPAAKAEQVGGLLVLGSTRMC